MLKGLPADSAFGTQLGLEHQERNAWRTEMDRLAGRQPATSTKTMHLDDFLRMN